MLVKGIGSLFAQLSAITEEKNSFRPLGANHQLRECNGDAGFSGSCSLDHQCLTTAAIKGLTDSFDGLDLIEAIGNGLLGVECREDVLALVGLKKDVFQAVLRIETEELAGWLGLGVIPQIEIVAIGEKDQRALAIHFLQAIGVIFRLHFALLRVFGGLFRFHNRKGFAVFAPQDVIDVALPTCGGLVEHFHFLANLRCADAASADIPAGLYEQ